MEPGTGSASGSEAVAPGTAGGVAGGGDAVAGVTPTVAPAGGAGVAAGAGGGGGDGGAGGDGDDEDVDKPDGYVPPAKVTLAELVAKDAEDESLRRYKEQLLGAAAAGGGSVTADGRHVIVHEMRIEVEGRPDIVIPLSTAEEVAAAEKLKLVVKEGCSYVTKIVFSVHNNIVVGLTLKNVVHGVVSGLQLDKVKYVAGSYPPTGTKQEFRLPVGEWPSGMFARGAYRATTTITDDDGETHLSFTWQFEIARTWPDGT